MKPGLSTPHRVICPDHQTKKMRHYFAGAEIYSFHYQMDILRRLPEKEREGKPFWYAPDERFLPGHSSVASTACSLACLLRPRVTVLVGIDFTMPERFWQGWMIAVSLYAVGRTAEKIGTAGKLGDVASMITGKKRKRSSLLED